MNNAILAFLCIGFHQLFEFFSEVTNNTIVYKIGLIISMSCMYFILKGFEILVNKKIHSQMALVLIIGFSIFAFLTNLGFDIYAFYLRHNNAFIWSFIWLALFFYWHICTLVSLRELKNKDTRKTLIFFLLASLDISFILAGFYVIIGHFAFNVNVCTDTPSVWCTFAVVQSIFIPCFLARVPYIVGRSKKTKHQVIRDTFRYMVYAIIVVMGFALSLGFFDCLSWKFIFP